MTRLRAAILGCGGFASQHAQNLLQLKDEVELVAVADRHAERAKSIADGYAPQAAIFTNHQDLFAQAALDLVLVCLPPYGHTDEVDLAAQHGVHVFIEKPIALSSEQAWHMVEVSEKAGIKTQVGFQLRFGAAVHRLKALQAEGVAGPAGLMSARYFCNSLHTDWWRVKEKSGGQMLEQVIHLVDLMRFLMGEAVSVYSLQNKMFHRDVPNYTVEDVSGTVIGFESGGIGVINATNNAIPNQWTYDFRVVTRAITAEFDNASHARFTYTSTPDLKVEKVADEQENLIQREILDLLRAIRTGTETLTPLREGAKTLDLALAAVRSAETRQVINF